MYKLKKLTAFPFSSSAHAYQFSTFKKLEPYSAGGVRDTQRDSADHPAPLWRALPSDSGLSFGDLVSGSSRAISNPRSSLHSYSPHESIESAGIHRNLVLGGGHEGLWTFVVVICSQVLEISSALQNRCCAGWLQKPSDLLTLMSFRSQKSL